MMAVRGWLISWAAPATRVAEGGQLLFLHKLALQALLALVSAARFLQQGHECLVLEKLAQEYERSQQQHGGQDGENAEGAGGRGGVVQQDGPDAQHGKRQEGQHGEAREDLPPARMQVEFAICRFQSRADKAVAAIQATVAISGMS